MEKGGQREDEERQRGERVGGIREEREGERRRVKEGSRKKRIGGE